MNTYAIDPAVKRITEGMIHRAERPTITAVSLDLNSGANVAFDYHNKRTGLELDFEIHPFGADKNPNFVSRTNQISLPAVYRILEKTFAPQLVISAYHSRMARISERGSALFELKTDGAKYVESDVRFTSEFKELADISEALQKFATRRPNLDGIVNTIFALWDIPSKQLFDKYLQAKRK